jgi:hypothetical protein
MIADQNVLGDAVFNLISRSAEYWYYINTCSACG